MKKEMTKIALANTGLTVANITGAIIGAPKLKHLIEDAGVPSGGATAITVVGIVGWFIGSPRFLNRVILKKQYTAIGKEITDTVSNKWDEMFPNEETLADQEEAAVAEENMNK